MYCIERGAISGSEATLPRFRMEKSGLGLSTGQGFYKNSAPIFDPRRHLTRARRPELALRDINKVNMPGTVSVAGIVI
jgi:hypothetical protein